MILYHSADLIWATKIKGAADALGLAARPVRTIEMLEARLADTKPVALIVDLDAAEVAMAMIGRVRTGGVPGPIRVLAFGPHIAAGDLAAAKAAGADAVMARGAFHARMSSILKDLASGDAVRDLTED